MFVICDVDNVVHDMASTQNNLARGLPYLAVGGKCYATEEGGWSFLRVLDGRVVPYWIPEEVGSEEWVQWQNDIGAAREYPTTRCDTFAADAWVGDHFDGTTLTPDSPLRAIALAEEQENTRLGKVMAALVGIKGDIEAEVNALTLAEVTGWLAAINNVGASPNAATFATRWAAYEKKRTLFEIELIRLLVR